MRISEEKKQKIIEHLLSLLYSNHLKSMFTSEIAKELARDEEFIKRLLLELEKQGLVLKITKNTSGKKYSRRIRWRLTNKALSAYSKNL